MKKTRRIAWSLVAVLAITTAGVYAAVWSFQPPASPRILFLAGGDSAYWDLTARGARAAAEHYRIDLTVELPAGGLAAQNAVLDSFDSGLFDGVAISPQSPESQADRLKRLAATTPLITFDSDAKGSGRICYVGTDNYSAGRLAAELVFEAVPDGGDIAVLTANYIKDNAKLRVKGFKNVLAAGPSPGVEQDKEPPQYKLVDVRVDEIHPERCAENIRDLLSKHRGLKAIVGLFGYHGPILLETLEDNTDVALVVFDEHPAVLDGIESGKIYATVVQDPFKYGYESVRLLGAVGKGRMVELPLFDCGAIFVPCEPVRQRDLADYRNSLRKRTSDGKPQ